MTTTITSMMPTRVAQIAIPVSDLPSAMAFYRDVLGLRFLFEAPPGLAFFDCGGVRLMLTPPLGSTETIVYYGVDDIQAAARAFESRGATLEEPPHVVARLATMDVWIASLRDPDGHFVGIMCETARTAD